ncbi:MAG: sigma 54-interacting transcriptional regulator [Archangiaceae bacterium]|nr:sigma 54-interacting transcriptional regulator [Archangiaceae bacterium]
MVPSLAVSVTAPPTDALTPARAQPARALKLCVAAGPDFGRELLLEKSSYRVGKAADCDLVLTDRSVSNTHLLVEPTPSGVRVTDMGSTNGTVYRGARVTSAVLTAPAVLKLGRTELKLQLRDQPVEALPPSDASAFGGLLGQSLPMRQLFARLERIAETDATVLIQAETGTGKELCARALHQHGKRRERPFEVCDLAALAPTLCESELFGHVAGAFTGAAGAHPGVFERASGGTLFLDEVGEMPLELQSRLLRALEQREIKRVGGSGVVKVDVRVIAATHRDLLEAVKAGRFREDLYFRLAAVTVELPPLRERPEDLSMLIDHFLAQEKRPAGEMRPETRELLADYPWPGNVRELRNVVTQVVSLGEAATLPKVAVPEATPAPDGKYKDAKDALVDAFERDYFERLLKHHDFNVTRAAAAAGITRVYMQKLMKKHGWRSNG